MKVIAAIVLALLVGCTSMPDVKVEGVDNLKVTEHKLGPIDVAFLCAERMRLPALMVFLATPLACATIVLETWTCDIYYSELFASVSLEHEREHCRGKWHDSSLQEYYDRWLAGGGKRP